MYAVMLRIAEKFMP